jgi:hypothetical protein
MTFPAHHREHVFNALKVRRNPKKPDIDKIKTRYAKQDIALLEKEGDMAIVETRLGVIWGNYSNGVYMFSKNGGIMGGLYKGNKDGAINFLKDTYQVIQK